MEHLLVTFLLSATFAIIGGVIYASYRREKLRTEQIRTAASELGLAFHPKQVDALRFNIGDFRLFNTGRSRKYKNIVVAETPEARIGLFDYQYTVGGGKNSRTYRQTVAVIESESLTIPQFGMRPEVSLFDAIGNMIGFQDIDFEHHPEFSAAFVLKSPDEFATRDFLSTQLLDFFARQPKISLEARPGAVIYFRANKRIKAAELRDFFEQAFAVYKVLGDRVAEVTAREPSQAPVEPDAR